MPYPSPTTHVPPAPAGEFIPHTRGLCSPDPLVRLQAHTVHALGGIVAANTFVFLGVSPELEPDRAVGLQTDPVRFSMHDAWRHYVAHVQHIDPFAPRRVAASSAPVLRLAEVSAEPDPARSPFGLYLRSMGLGDRMNVYLRDGSRIAATIAICRSRERPPFDRADAAALRRLQPLLEHAYLCAVAATPTAPVSDLVLEAGLTARELDVATLVGRGASNAEIARSLHVSEATVKTHLTHIYAKFGVRTRTQLAVLLGGQRPAATAAT
jgi:DNA-binding CsgD family transcriptional regulator